MEGEYFYPNRRGQKPEEEEEEDDLYGGFGTYEDEYDAYDEYAVAGGDPYGYGGHGVPMTAAGKPLTGMGLIPPGTAANLYGDGAGDMNVRPVTSVRAAGYQAPGRAVFDPFNSNKGPALPLQKRSENSPEEMALEKEKEVHALLEKSTMSTAEGNFARALDEARDCGKKERQLCKFREHNNLGETINVDLTYAVAFNLALCYENNGMFTEALNTYTLIIRNKQYPQAGRLRVNMGNIFFKQKNYPMAVKMYHMAVDQIPAGTNNELRYRIMRNIGIAFVKMGSTKTDEGIIKYDEALVNFQEVMDGSPDPATGFNMLLCLFALGDPVRMKEGFMQLLNSKFFKPPKERLDEEDDEDEDSDDEDVEDMEDDALRDELKERQKLAQKYFLLAAKLIGPVIEETPEEGFDFVVEQLKVAGGNNQFMNELASEVEMHKALVFLKNKEIDDAIRVLKSFEKKDKKLKARAATNLSYLYLLEGRIDQAEKYSSLAVESDRYNPKALVNQGNVFFHQGKYVDAESAYVEAMSLEADLIEAVYNLGLLNKRLERFNTALQNFKLVYKLMPTSLDVLYQMGDIYDTLHERELENLPEEDVDPEHLERSKEYFDKLVTRTPTDPGVLSRLGQLYSKDNDESQAYHYFSESFRYYPVNMDVISWLGSYYVKNDVFEKAVDFFDRASHIESDKIEWKLLVAGCYRRLGRYQEAKEVYEAIHHKYPENMECLQYLVQLCQDLGFPRDAQEYNKLLIKLEERTRHDLGSMPTPETTGGPSGGRNHASSYGEEQPFVQTQKEFGLQPKTIGGRGGDFDEDDWGTEELDELLP